jgi:hypothetical protein
VEASLHQDFDKTASFVLLPKLPQLHAISSKLKDSNADWQARTQEFGDVARLLKVRFFWRDGLEKPTKGAGQ